MTTGEGGAVAVSSEEEWALLKSLSNQGRSDSGEWLTHARLGYNYRLDDLSAALGLAQLERYDEILAARGEVAARYAELLAAVDGVEVPLPDDDDHRRSWFVYVVRLDAGDRPERRDRTARRAEGVAAKPYLPSIHLQPYYRERFGYREGDAARLGGHERANAGATVPLAPRGPGSGTGRRRARAGARPDGYELVTISRLSRFPRVRGFGIGSRPSGRGGGSPSSRRA